MTKHHCTVAPESVLTQGRKTRITTYRVWCNKVNCDFEDKAGTFQDAEGRAAYHTKYPHHRAKVNV